MINETDTAGYRGKTFEIPKLSATGDRFVGTPNPYAGAVPPTNTIRKDLNSIWDLKKFMEPRVPIEVSLLTEEERHTLGTTPVVRILDMPIKFPHTDYRLPTELSGLLWLAKRVANYEAWMNGHNVDDYYCYLTVDRGPVKPNTTLREAPCHVDGFQGARWIPKLPINHTYTVSDVLSTKFYLQPFDFSKLDDTRHDFFWEMNRQVSLTNSVFAWQPPEGALTLMDAYTVHRGTESPIPQSRTFVRFSFEVRVFDRLGNAHNPMFDYDWEMRPRDIEELNLVAFDPESDPSLRVFPHQDLDGASLPRGVKTKPQLRPAKVSSSERLIWTPPPELLQMPGWVYGEELRQLSLAA